MIKVFSKEWFKKYNKILIRVAKLPIIGEWIFCIKKYGFELDRKNILEIQPNAVVEDMKLMWTKCVRINGQWVAYDCTNKLHNRLIKKEYKEKLLPTKKNHYFVRNEFALRLQKVFYPIWILFHIWDNITRPFPQLNLGFDTLTVYPDTGNGNTTVDGYCGRASDNSTFTEIRSGAGSSNNTTGNIISIQLNATSIYGTDKYSMITRGLLTFDTSSIDDAATISATVFSGYGYSKVNNNNLGTPDLHICSATPATDNNLANSDYGQLGTTSFGSKSYADFSTAGYNDFTLNASGISNISKTGISKFGIRNYWDISNTAPTWTNDGSSIYYIYASDYGSNKPKLVVTYTVVVAPTVTTQAGDLITMNSARGNGNITNNGGENATRRGFCYKEGTSGDPTTSDSTAYDDGSYGTGAYTKTITGLIPNTTYRVRAYAVNSAGTGYGTTVSAITDQSGRMLLMFQ